MPPPAKSDAPGATGKAAAKSEPATDAAAPAAAPAAPARGLSAWLPAIAAILLAPVATWATVELVLLPRLQKKIAAAVPEAVAAVPGAVGPKGAEGKTAEGPAHYEFKDVVVNLSGTMGTRYLRASFQVIGAKDADIKAAFDGAKPKLTDVTLNVLSSLTLADLEEPGAKNVIREKLVNAYNQALGRKVAEQVYFSDFVIQ